MLADLWSFGNSDVVNTISNSLTIPTLIGVVVTLWHAYHGRCSHRACFRPGQIPVEGTTRFLCCRHASRAGVSHT